MSGKITPRMSFDDYRAIDALNSSLLKEMRRSPQHFCHAKKCPKRSAPMSLGTAAHCAVLEPDRFAIDFAVWDSRTASGNMRPRNGKLWDAFEIVATANSQTIITEDEHSAALRMQAAIRGNPDAMRYLAAGDPEVTMEWEEAGRPCKGRVDWLTCIDGVDVLVGLKTARDCAPGPFGLQAVRLGYTLQWSWYHGGFEIASGRPPFMVEIVVENTPPHAVSVYSIPEEIIEIGQEENGRLLLRLAECEESGKWPGPTEGETPLTLPPWAYGDDLIITEVQE